MISPIQQVKYIIRLFDATSKIIISRLRWKCSYINKEVEEQYDKKYMVVFKISRSAAISEELKVFEINLFNTIKNIKFSSYKSKYEIKVRKKT